MRHKGLTKLGTLDRVQGQQVYLYRGVRVYYRRAGRWGKALGRWVQAGDPTQTLSHQEVLAILDTLNSKED